MKQGMDMTHGRLWPNILRFAIPLALTSMLQQLFNAADLAVVGRFAGTASMAAVGGNTPLINLMINLFVGISLGSNVVIANAIGQGDREKVSRSVHTSVMLALTGGVLVMCLAEAFAPMIVRRMGVPEEVFPLALRYLRIYCVGLPVILLYNYESAIFRAWGNTRTPLIVLAVSGALNVALNVLFVVGLRMDVDGVAIATVLSNALSALLLLGVLMRTEDAVRFMPKALRFYREPLMRMLAIGVPSGLQNMTYAFANIVIQSAVNSLGTTVMAASSAAYNIEIFAFYFVSAFGQACAAFTGQNFGAGERARCRRVLAVCLSMSFIMIALGCAFLYGNSVFFIGLFNPDPEVIAVGRVRLFYIFIAYLLSFHQDVISGYLRGFGISLTPSLCVMVGVVGIRMTWIFTVFRAAPSFGRLMMVYPISLGVTAAIVTLFAIVIRPSRTRTYTA